MTTNIYKAQHLARTAHKDIVSTTQTGIARPQVIHLQEVADLVWASGGSEEEIIAAWLHDSVEDTPTTLEQIEKEFGKNVAEIVHGLTDQDDIKDLPLFERKKLQAVRVKTKSESVRRIKIADQTSNVSFVSTDPPTSMNEQDCRHYVIAAKLIADECKGISPLLDKMFKEVYQKGAKRYSI